jgi:cellulose synthase/poly-beta-1,6-N-acetylglucosamine synthase-like glycosyltransferase
MVDFVTSVYLMYMFISIYFLSLFVLTFVQNKKEIFEIPKSKKEYSVSVLIPAYNEEDSIQGTVESVLASDYKNIVEILILDNNSKDRTAEISKNLETKYSKVRYILAEKQGKANALNKAIKIAKGELVAVVDADSYPEKHSLSSMVGFFEEEGVGAVTTRVQVRGADNFLRRLQSVEYKVIAFTRKLLGFVDAIYVTPGPLALYKKTALEKIGGFDPNNMTEDIEATWHLVYEGYKIRMSFVSKVTTVAPDSWKKWFVQRVRWNIGGMQTILKYKHAWFRRGMLGFFILPFFSMSLLLGVFGLGFFGWRVSLKILNFYLSTVSSIEVGASVLNYDLHLTPSILNFLGVILFLAGILFLFFALRVINKETGQKEGLFTVLFYSLIYIAIYPIILITSLYKLLRRKYSWR